MSTVDLPSQQSRSVHQPQAVVLMYHRLGLVPMDSARLAVSPERFRRQLSVLAGERVVPLAALPATTGAVALTFDDGYFDNLSIALPILEEFGMPATVFVAIDALAAREFWWEKEDHERLRASRGQAQWRRVLAAPAARVRDARRMASLRGLSPDDVERRFDAIDREIPSPCAYHRKLTMESLQELAASPLVEIGAHTCTHPNLTTLTDAERRWEIEHSKVVLEDAIGRSVDSFSYPYGAYDADTVRAVRSAGFKRACIVGGGAVGPDTDPFIIPRFMVRNVGGLAFRAFLKGWRRGGWRP